MQRERIEGIVLEAKNALRELLAASCLHPQEIVVVGCSTSEIAGVPIGKGSVPQLGEELVQAFVPIFEKRDLVLATQCCEHLNRALVIDQKAAKRLNLVPVQVVPYPKAGGSMASAYYRHLANPLMVERIQANAGLDIGETMIGMHLKHVAVPLRLCVRTVGHARVNAARTRPKLIGGVRARYE